MAKRGTLDHPKTRRVARSLKTVPGVILGLLETIWHQASQFHTDGRMTKLDLEDAFDAGGWLQMFDSDQLIAALSCQDHAWIEPLPDGSWYIHDWHIHAEDSVHSKLYRAIQTFGNGQKPSPKKIGERELQKLESEWARQPQPPINDGRGSRAPIAESSSAAEVPPKEAARQPALALAIATPKPMPLPLPAPVAEPTTTAAATSESEFRNYSESDFAPPRQSDLSILDRFDPPIPQLTIQVAIEYCMRRYGGSKHHEPWYKDLLNEIGSVLEVQPDPEEAASKLINTCKQVKEHQLNRGNPFSDIAIYCGMKPPRGQTQFADKAKAEERARAKAITEKAWAEEEARRMAKLGPATLPLTPPPRPIDPKQLVSNIANGFSAEKAS